LSAAMLQTLDHPQPRQTLIDAMHEYKQEISASRYLELLKA